MQRLRKRVWLIGWMLLSGSNLPAQCPDRTPTTFTGALRTTSTYGCVPLRVECSNTQIGVQNIRYHYEYDKTKPAAPTITASSYTYTKPGQYYLVQYSEKEGLTMVSCAEVWVYDTLPPKVELTACGTRASLRITDPLAFPMNYDYFLINWGDGQTDTLRTAPATPTHTYATTDPRQIRVQGVHRYGTCGGTTTQRFTPNQPASVRSVEPVSEGIVRVQIANPGSLSLTLQTRVGAAGFGGGRAVPGGTAPAVEMPIDTAQTTCFRVVPGGNCPGYSPSDELCYTPPPRPPKPTAVATLYLPDAFSPNNDGLNDVFGPVGSAPTGSYQLTIYDRWGSVVFKSDDPGLGWDGFVNGRVAPIGSYVYQVQTSSFRGQIHQKSGRLQLIR